MPNNTKCCHSGEKDARNFADNGASGTVSEDRQVHFVSFGESEKDPGVQGRQPVAIQKKDDRRMALEEFKHE